ncbi:hypothetical protein JWJ90_05080 [Desulfobulbus rhabdoformis]|uniref:hypothetical protein n=1 Tax=Desulfobulbus rhabdoformis TaxID=34032 RepID=UPI001965F943|nr:hypothetical protein [Desulfobulbus rhabdoformis]MBM9613659.1 hypothetical protein [Desulfobulbus rhabdoformis]
MNKVIVVGHPFSGYSEVEQLLLECGMASALPSHQEKLTPQEIDLMLCKAHDVAPLSIADLQDPIFDQIDIGVVWHGMILDLMRGNLGQQFWGWGDPQAIYLLDFWKTIDPKIAFILVYNHPRTALRNNPTEADSGHSDQEKNELDCWTAYNDTLLHFYQRNTERCLLVHAEQVRTSVNSYLQQLKTRLDAPIGQIQDDCSLQQKTEQIREETATYTAEDEANLQCQTALAAFTKKQDPLEIFLASEVIEQFPEAMELYEELQAIATLPYSNNLTSSHSAFLAWQTFSRLKRDNDNITKKYQKLNTETETLNNEKIKYLQKNNEIQQENDLLIQQVLQLQKDLDKYYAQSHDCMIKNQDFKQIEKKFTKQSIELIQNKKIINDLNKKLDDLKRKSHESKNKTDRDTSKLKEENELLLLQLHQVQEELEQYFLENTKLRKNQLPVHYGAAERVKSELPYLIGAAIIQRSRKGWPLLFLPFSMRPLARRYRQSAQQHDNPLPPLSEYHDFPEAQRVMKHLSYRLGTTWLKHCRTPWGLLIMPFALMKADKQFQQYKNQ